MGKGRPRKPGKRNKSGRLLAEVRRDYGTDQAIARRDMFGENGCDAIGRAFVIGALGTGDIARDRLSAGRAIYSEYWRHIGGAGYRCPLDRSPTGGQSAPLTPEQHQRELERERRLNRRLDDARKAGHPEYQAFSQLVIDLNPDSGPGWLDVLCCAWAFGKVFGHIDPQYTTAIARALRGLDAAMGVSEPMAIAA